MSARLFIAALPLLCGCAVGPDFVRPESPKVDQYTMGKEPTETISAGGHAQRFDSGFAVPADWWKLFNAPKLDPIVTNALDHNQTIQAALATLRQSQANLDAGYGVFYPQLNAGFGATRERSNPKSFGVNASGSIFNIFSLSGTVSYPLDVFGGARRALEGLSAQVEDQRYAVLAAYLTITGNIVNTVIARAAYQAEIEATEAIVKAMEDQVSLTRAQARAGTTAYVNLLSIESQLLNTQATLPPLRQKLVQTDDLLAVLSGLTPAESGPVEIELDELTLPERLPKEVPSKLAHSRPDILMSESLLHVASAQVGVATAALYPSLSLTGTFGVSSSSFDSLLQSNNAFWNLGTGLTAPLFRGGQLRSQRQAAIEAYTAAGANYRQTVLTAFRQVADALRALEHDAESVDAQSKALAASDEALRLIRANYRAGTATYLQVLIANSQFLQAKLGSLGATAQRLQDTVALIVALGGRKE